MSGFLGSLGGSSAQPVGAPGKLPLKLILILHVVLTELILDLAARKQAIMDQVRNELALHGAQELINVCR